MRVHHDFNNWGNRFLLGVGRIISSPRAQPPNTAGEGEDTAASPLFKSYFSALSTKSTSE